MNQEIARKRPATVRPALPRAEILTASVHSKAVLLAQVHAMARRGEIGQTYDLRHVPSGWAVKVIRIAEPAGWWRRNAVRASLLAGGALGLLWLLSIAVRVLASALAAAVPLLIGGGILLGLASIVGGRRVINIVQRVDVKR